MSALLLIPWFKPEPITIPLPFEIPLFWVSELKIHPFGLLVGTGVLVGMKVAEVYGKRRGIAPWVVADLVWHVLGWGFLCAYFLNGLFYEPDRLFEVLTHPSKLFTEWLGLSSYGGFIGSALGAAIWRVRRKVSFMAVGDAVAFGFPAGWFFGRLGCFVAHDHPGNVSDFFLAVDNYHGLGVPRHDLGLYEVFWSAAAVGIFVWLARRYRDLPRGTFVALLPLLYTPIRFFLDYLRATPEDGGDVRYFGFTPGQYASVAMFLVGLAVLHWVRTRPTPTVPADAAWPPPEDASPEAGTSAPATK